MLRSSLFLIIHGHIGPLTHYEYPSAHVPYRPSLLIHGPTWRWPISREALYVSAIALHLSLLTIQMSGNIKSCTIRVLATLKCRSGKTPIRDLQRPRRRSKMITPGSFGKNSNSAKATTALEDDHTELVRGGALWLRTRLLAGSTQPT